MYLLIPIFKKASTSPILLNCRNSRVLTNSYLWKSECHPSCLVHQPQSVSSPIHAHWEGAANRSVANHPLRFLDSIFLQLLLPTPVLLHPSRGRDPYFNYLMSLLSVTATFRNDLSENSGKWKGALQHQEYSKMY